MTTVQTNQFQPTSITGCQLWLDSADTSTLSLTGPNVNQWNDKSGNGRNAVFSTSNFATRTSINSGLSFSNSYYTTTYTADPTNESLFIAFRSLSPKNTIMLSSPNPNGRFVGIPTDIIAPIGYSIGFGKDSVTWGATTPITSNANVLTTVQFSSGSFSRISANGGTYSNYTALTFNSGSNTNIGGALSSGSLILPYIGLLYEIIAYNSVLSASNTQIVEGYLAWKWGTQTSLPSTHPYRYMPPSSTGAAIIGVPLSLPTVSLGQSQSVFSFGYNPATSITNCTLWLDAADLTTLTLSGTNVTQWRDKSGLGNNATSTGTSPLVSRPYRPAGIQFTGTNYFTGANINTGTTLSAFAVAEMSSSTSTYGRILSFSIPGSNDYDSVTRTSAIIRNVSLQSILSYRTTDLANAAITYDTPFVGETIFTGTNQTMYATGNAGTTVSSSGSFNYSVYAIGGQAGVAGATLTGYVYEVIAYNASLSTAQRQQVEGYLAWKWGLATNLPSNHPYKNAPPGINLAVSIPPQLTLQYSIFRPTQISGLQLWLDGQDPLNTGVPPANGTAISTWFDRSGNSRHATQTTGALQPTYLLSGTSINFSGANYLNMSNAYSMMSAPTYAYNFFIVERRGSSNSTQFLFAGSNAGQSIFFGYNNNTNQTHTYAVNIDLTYTLSGWANPDPFRIWSGGYSGSIRDTCLNGTQVASQGYTFGAITGWTTPVIGYIPLSAINTYYTGVISEILFYNSYLTLIQRQSIEGYLAWKWNLVGNLPANHPFKKFPPPPSQ